LKTQRRKKTSGPQHVMQQLISQ